MLANYGYSYEEPQPGMQGYVAFRNYSTTRRPINAVIPFQAKRYGIASTALQLMDMNQDGIVTRTDFELLMKSLGCGRIIQKLSRFVFNRLDSNHDQVIDPWDLLKSLHLIKIRPFTK